MQSLASKDIEDEGQLLDAVLLTRPGDEVGPADRMLMDWRRLTGMPAEKLRTAATVGTVLEEFGHASDDMAISDLADKFRWLSAGGLSGC